MERQAFMLSRVLEVCGKDSDFQDFSSVSGFYKKLINLFKQMNYSAFRSEAFQDFNSQLDEVFENQKSLIS